MRSRQEIKAIGKQRFQSYYWHSVGAFALITGILAVITGMSTGFTYTLSLPSLFSAVSDGDPAAVIAAMTPVYGFTYIFSLCILIITGPLEIGLNYFYIQLILGRTDRINAVTPLRTAFTNFGRKLGGYLWMELFTFLWSLLFLVPGIIKSFSYAMAPYILADCPNVRAKDALKLSMRIMKGHKWKLFVFKLSFLGWLILSALTENILGIFFVYPYLQSAAACWYLEVREEALRNGVITMGQLEGTEAV